MTNNANTTSMSSTVGTLPYVRDPVGLHSRTSSGERLAFCFLGASQEVTNVLALGPDSRTSSCQDVQKSKICRSLSNIALSQGTVLPVVETASDAATESAKCAVPKAWRRGFWSLVITDR